MVKKYTRLKLKMLLLVVLGAAGLPPQWGCSCWRWWWTACSRTPLPGLCVGGSGDFRPQPGGGPGPLQQIIRNNKPIILNCAMLALMLAAFYLAMGRFTRWLDQIGQATRRLVSDSGEEIRLPRELSPVEEDLRAIQRQLRSREAEARENEERKRDLVAFLAHRFEDAPHLGGGLSHPPAGPSGDGRRTAGQVHRHRPGQGRAPGGAAGRSSSISPAWTWRAGGQRLYRPADHAAGAAGRRVLPPLRGKGPQMRRADRAQAHRVRRPGQAGPGV